MRNTQLGDKIKVLLAMVPTIGIVGAQTTVEVDGRGYERALWMLTTGVATSTAKLDFKIRNAVATGMGSDADQAGAVLTQVPDTGGSKVYTIDAPVDPARPFMKPTCTTTTAAMVCGAICILYKGYGGSGAAGIYPVATTYATQAVVV